MRIRPAGSRLPTKAGWLDSKHSFSFGHHYDPQWTGSGALLVINDDTVAPGAGFGTHGHSDMEIISVVLSGKLTHKDSQGNIGHLLPGMVQRMSAGTGIRHSEYNGSDTEHVHFLQIWIRPHSQGLAPSYEEAQVPDQKGKVILAGSGGLMAINQDAELAQYRLDAGDEVAFKAESRRKRYLHVIEGGISAGELRLGPGDGLELSAGEERRFSADGEAWFLAFDVPA
ncbi:pirin family protein [Gallaecimonas kandeliae]|uniref:pirin family protein n=1 Tax=Gallaecimonas kandeliae TaxID=3029055 RepID=UPI002648F3BA|nr:pirin-like bicupin family protein [Gallaecimonas kandeliae]WKE65438.1 pirin family protein [Gallaecimonas kandeliae]